MKLKHTATAAAILAAALYAINIPLSKLLLVHIEPTMMAALLYLGAGLGLLLCGGVQKLTGRSGNAQRLTKKELPYTIAMILLDIIAPILLMLGIAETNAANVSLLNNFEIAATSVIALAVFRETVTKRMWAAIALVTLSSILLGFEGSDAFVFNRGSLFVLGACLCWGMENNCTKMISHKSSTEIVILKGCFSGTGSLIIALTLGQRFPAWPWILLALALGFVSYGLSIYFYILAQKHLGAAKTSAYYSVAPFLGVAFGLILLGEKPAPQFYAALLIMIASTILMVLDSVALQHTHEHQHTHTHEHSHGELVHTHEHTHTHSHFHVHENGRKHEKTRGENDVHENDAEHSAALHVHAHNLSELKDHRHTHDDAAIAVRSCLSADSFSDS